MNSVINLIKNRHSYRSFKSEEIPLKDIKTILEISSNAPSGANMQPFNIYSVSGNKLIDITNSIINHIEKGGDIEQDIQYYPVEWTPEIKKRRMETGLNLYSLLEINRRDKKKRKEQWFENFKWFGSKNVLFFTINKKLIKNSQGMFIDSGILLQTIIMVSESLGYKTCPQGSSTEYGKIIKKELNIDEEESLLFSLVIGKPTKDIINSYKPSKINYKKTTKFIFK